VPQPDGTQKALEVHVMNDSLRGEGEGFHPWSGATNGTMTNATVREINNATVEGVNGRVLTVKYPGGEQKLFVGPTTPVVRFTAGDRGSLVPGAHVRISAAKQSDGSLTARYVNVGKNGFTPSI
jgi:hypothetical protein